MHDCRYGKVRPVTNADFWETKRQSNLKRDRRNIGLLKKAGWQVLIVWECETRNPEALKKTLVDFLGTVG